jgi:phosphoribosylaminoimidazole-succinocarboxamide synthase
VNELLKHSSRARNSPGGLQARVRKTAEERSSFADEISPDRCRFWDRGSGDRLDKDRFRKDLGNVLEAYETIWNRLSGEGRA